MDDVTFMDIVPRDNVYLKYSVEPVPLRVLVGDGVSFTPDIDINVNDLNTGKKNFLNHSGDGDRFKIKIIIKEIDTFTGSYDVYFNPSYQPDGSYIDHFTYHDTLKVADALDYWIRNMVPLMVRSKGVDVPDGLYVVTGNGSRKQTHKTASVWELEFTKYEVIPFKSVRTTGTNITTAIKKYEEAKKKKKNTTSTKSTVNSSSSLNSKLKKCKVSNLKYSKTKKVVACVKTLQGYLNKKGFGNLKVDGWYGDATLKAVKKFQQKYKSKYKLTVNGKMDSKTLDAMTKV